MNLLSVENISKSYGERTLFKDVSFGINQGQKVALVAKNGVGKTTLIDIINRQKEADSGNIVYRKGIKVSYLEQDPLLPEEKTIEELVYNTDNSTLRTIKNYNNIINDPEQFEKIQDAIDEMDRSDAWDYEVFVKQILSKLKIENLDSKISTLSGGQKKRVAMAQVLLNKPDLLILDEPTNHLDLEMVEWLEEFLSSEKFSIFMVTHDRYFLDRVCNEIIELDRETVYKYSGNYSYYLNKKAEREASEASSIEKAKNLFGKELEWMRRQPKARTTKSKSRIDAFSELKKKAKQKISERELKIEINMQRLGSKTIEIHNLGFNYDDLKIIEHFDYIFKRSERVGIIGKNGVGKSTFLDLITGGLKPKQGKVVVGETVKFGFYRQDGINFKEGAKVIDTIKEVAEFIPLAKGQKITAAQLLERFLFDRKKQYDFIEKLSGGERRRLYLCKILMENPNILILDEPTNDLDILTLNVLEDFLQDFPGILIVVSHDRFFMDKIIDHLFVLEGDGKHRDFPGNYSEYRDYITLENRENQKDQKKEEQKAKKKDSNRKPKMNFKEKKEFDTLEKELEKLNSRRDEINQMFEKGDILGSDIEKISIELSEINEKIDQKEERWLELSMIEED
jgi:ATP-binding cassette subfamily F protein uup